jgi:hypothetical protein
MIPIVTIRIPVWAVSARITTWPAELLVQEGMPITVIRPVMDLVAVVIWLGLIAVTAVSVPKIYVIRETGHVVIQTWPMEHPVTGGTVIGVIPPVIALLHVSLLLSIVQTMEEGFVMEQRCVIQAMAIAWRAPL